MTPYTRYPFSASLELMHAGVNKIEVAQFTRNTMKEDKSEPI